MASVIPVFMRRLTHLIVLAAFIFSCGGQWAAFQAIAWGNMIREYSQMVPLTQAVQMTFSGEYPCKICRAIADKRSTEQQKVLGLDKVDKAFLSLSFEGRQIEFRSSPMAYLDRAASLQFWSDAPSRPPPRSTLI